MAPARRRHASPSGPRAAVALGDRGDDGCVRPNLAARQGHGDFGLGEIKQPLPSFGGPVEFRRIAGLGQPPADGPRVDTKRPPRGLGAGDTA